MSNELLPEWVESVGTTVHAELSRANVIAYLEMSEDTAFKVATAAINAMLPLFEQAAADWLGTDEAGMIAFTHHGYMRDLANAVRTGEWRKP